MSLYQSKNSSSLSSASSEVEHSAAFKRLLNDLSFERFLDLLKSGEFPVLDTKDKPADYHKRRFDRLELNEKFALFDELLLECLNSPRRLEPIGIRGGATRIIHTGTIYQRELVTILENLPISESLSREALSRLNFLVSNPSENLSELFELDFLTNLIPDEALEQQEIKSLISGRIDWELEHRFDKFLEIAEIEIFAINIIEYKKDELKKDHIKNCIKKYLSEIPETWTEKTEREYQNLEGDPLSNVLQNIDQEDSNAPQKIAGIITLFEVSEILDDPEYLSLVGQAIDREMSGRILFGVNQWLGVLDRNRAGVKRLTNQVQALIDNRREVVCELLEDLLMQDTFIGYDVTVVKETCRNFFKPENYSSESFCSAVHTALRTLVENDASIYRLSSLSRLLPKHKRSEILEDVELRTGILEKFEAELELANQEVRNLSIVDFVITDNDDIAINKIVNVYRKQTALRKAADTFSIYSADIAECPDWVELIGRSHPLIGDYISRPIESGEGRPSEKVSILGASWKNSLEYAQDCYINNNTDYAWFISKQLIVEASRIDHLRYHLGHIGEALELLALSSPAGSEKEQNFRTALVFRMRQMGLLSQEVRQTLAEYSLYLRQSDRPCRTINYLAKLIFYFNSSSISEELYQSLQTAIRDIYFDNSELAEELGFPAGLFHKIVSDCPNGSNL